MRVEVEGASLHAEVRGVGPPVLLIHGATGDSTAYWKPIVPALESHFRVITYDQRGFGRSEAEPARLDIGTLADDAAALIDEVADEPCGVVGMSLGGIVAQELAARSPFRVRRLVLTSAPPEIGTRLRLLGRVLAAVGELGDRGLLFDLNLLFAHGERHLDLQSDRVELERRAFAQTASWQAPVSGGPPDWEGVEPGAVTHPTLIVYGSEDAEMPMRYAHELRERIPHARLVILEGVGHKVMVEEPDTFAGLVGGFLAEDTASG